MNYTNIFISLTVIVLALLLIKLLYDNFFNDTESFEPEQIETTPETLIKDCVKRGNYKRAIRIHKREIKDGNYEFAKKLAELYYSLTEGDAESDTLKNAIKYYKIAIRNGFLECLIKLGDIYNYYDIVNCESNILCGRKNGLTPSKQIAYNIYLAIINNKHINDNDKVLARERIQDLELESNKYIFYNGNKENMYNNPENFKVGNEKNDVKGIKFDPFSIENDRYTSALKNRKNEIETIRAKAKLAERKRKEWEIATRTRRGIVIDDEGTDDDEYRIGDIIEVAEMVRPVTPRKEEKIRSDPQNVHSSTVVGSVSNSIKKIKNSIDRIIPLNDALKEIRDHVKNNNKLNPLQKDLAIKALDTSERNTMAVSPCNETEPEVLRIIWSRIHHKDNIDRKDDLKDNLIQALLDSNERGTVVCASGRISHYISSLEGADRNQELVNIKPEWAIKEEMSYLISKLRNEELNRQPQEIQQLYVSGPNNQEEDMKLKSFIRNMKNNIYKELDKKYKRSGIMRSEKFETMIKPYLDALE